MPDSYVFNSKCPRSACVGVGVLACFAMSGHKPTPHTWALEEIHVFYKIHNAHCAVLSKCKVLQCVRKRHFTWYNREKSLNWTCSENADTIP